MASYLKIANNAEQVAVSLNGQNITINSNPGSGTYLTASYDEADGTLAMGTNTNPNNAVVIGENDNDVNIDYPSGKQYELYSSADKPYLKVNSSYLPLTTQTGTVTGLKVKNGSVSYLPVQSTSASGSYETTTNTTISSWSGTKNEMTYGGGWVDYFNINGNTIRVAMTTKANNYLMTITDNVAISQFMSNTNLYGPAYIYPQIIADYGPNIGYISNFGNGRVLLAVVNFRYDYLMQIPGLFFYNKSFKYYFTKANYTRTSAAFQGVGNVSSYAPPRYSTKTYYSPTQNASASVSYPVNTTSQTTSSSSMSTTEVA